MKIFDPKKAFTLVEIMIVVAIIGMLSAIAIPNFAKSRDATETNACIKNMINVRSTVDMWALETSSEAGAAPLKTDIVPGYLRTWPTCGSREYEIPAVGSNPTCPVSRDGHVLNVPEPTN